MTDEERLVLIRAVLDGKTLQFRGTGTADYAWQDTKDDPIVVISNIAKRLNHIEYRVKPETLVQYFVATTQPTELLSLETLKSYAKRNGSKVLRIELDPDTMAVIDARTEEP